MPIDVTEAGIVIDVKPVQPWNALPPIDLTKAGILIDVKPVQPEKTLLPIDVTVTLPNIPGIFNGPNCAFGKNPVIEPAAV